MHVCYILKSLLQFAICLEIFWLDNSKGKWHKLKNLTIIDMPCVKSRQIKRLTLSRSG